jgi:hypothetical protein
MDQATYIENNYATKSGTGKRNRITVAKIARSDILSKKIHDFFRNCSL